MSNPRPLASFRCRGRKLAKHRLFLVVALAVGCSDDGDSAQTTTPAVAAACVPGDPVLRVDLIDDAVAAVEAERGGAQTYFEINATANLVNLFVADDDDTVTPYVFVDSTLSPGEAISGAQGATFEWSAVDIDPARVTSCVVAELPESEQTAFEILGGPDGLVQYTVIVTSQAGGQLLVEVAGDGTIIAVDTP